MIPLEVLRRGLRCGLAGLLLLASGVSHGRGDSTSSVWMIRGAHNTVYLAGSVHALPKDDAALPPQLEQAYRAAERIVMEVDLDDLNPMEAVAFVGSNGTLPEGQTLKDVIGAEKYAGVSRLAASVDLPEFALARLEPWAAAMLLTQFALLRSGFDPALGIDMQIAERARSDGKPIDGLETVIDQLGIFDARSIEEQIRFLVESTEDAPKLHDDLARLVGAWRAGNVQALEKEFLEERAQAPELYDALLGARNRKWMPQIESLTHVDDDVLVVVGALHFVGHDGLLELLRAAGYQLVPVRAAPKP